MAALALAVGVLGASALVVGVRAAAGRDAPVDAEHVGGGGADPHPRGIAAADLTTVDEPLALACVPSPGLDVWIARLPQCRDAARCANAAGRRRRRRQALAARRGAAAARARPAPRARPAAPARRGGAGTTGDAAAPGRRRPGAVDASADRRPDRRSRSRCWRSRPSTSPGGASTTSCAGRRASAAQPLPGRRAPERSRTIRPRTARSCTRCSPRTGRTTRTARTTVRWWSSSPGRPSW